MDPETDTAWIVKANESAFETCKKHTKFCPGAIVFLFINHISGLYNDCFYLLVQLNKKFKFNYEINFTILGKQLHSQIFAAISVGIALLHLLDTNRGFRYKHALIAAVFQHACSEWPK